MLGVNTISSKRLSVKLRVYYDDVRVLGGTTLTFTKSEFGQYHVFKFIADFVNEAGEVVEKFRKKVYWFVSTVNQSVITEDFGDEYDGDETVKVSKVTISGSSYLSDFNTHNYTLTFTPEYADVGVSSVQVTANVGSSVLKVTNVSKSGFTLQAVSLPDEEQTIMLTIKTTLEDGTSFNTTHQIAIIKPYVVFLNSDYYAAKASFDAVNGKGSQGYRMQIRPGNSGAYTIKSVTSSNTTIKVAIEDKTFTLSVSGITKDEAAVITAVVEYDGMQLTATMTVRAILKNAWSIETLDIAGVLIVDVNGMFYTKSEWLASGILNDDADGIAVSDGTHRFIIGKKQFKGKIGGATYQGQIDNGNGTFSEKYTGTLVSGQFTTDSATTAETDFNGLANTNALISQVSDTDVRQLRTTQQFPSGITAYLGTAGEWAVVQSKLDAVKDLLAVIEADGLGGSGWTDQATSTQKNDGYEWEHGFEYSPYTRSEEKWSTNTFIRAFAAVREITNPVTRGKIEIVGVESFTTSNGSGSATFALEYTPNGATVSEVSVVSSNAEFVVSDVSNSGFKLAVSGLVVNRETTITVKARVNGLTEFATKKIAAVTGTSIDLDKLDTAKALIIDKNYNLYTEEEWYGASVGMNDVEGIAVSDGTHRFIVAKTNAGSSQFGGALEVTKYGTNDFDGEGNTEQMITRWPSSQNYAITCGETARNYTFPSGKAGYCGSGGEWNIVLKNLSLVQRLLEAVGADKLSGDMWTSSMSDGTYACRARIGLGYVQGSFYKNYEAPVRSFRKLL